MELYVHALLVSGGPEQGCVLRGVTACVPRRAIECADGQQHGVRVCCWPTAYRFSADGAVLVIRSAFDGPTRSPSVVQHVRAPDQRRALGRWRPRRRSDGPVCTVLGRERRPGSGLRSRFAQLGEPGNCAPPPIAQPPGMELWQVPVRRPGSEPGPERLCISRRCPRPRAPCRWPLGSLGRGKWGRKIVPGQEERSYWVKAVAQRRYDLIALCTAGGRLNPLVSSLNRARSR
jgi:hypothetical protein